MYLLASSIDRRKYGPTTAQNLNQLDYQVVTVSNYGWCHTTAAVTQDLPRLWWLYFRSGLKLWLWSLSTYIHVHLWCTTFHTIDRQDQFLTWEFGCSLNTEPLPETNGWNQCSYSLRPSQRPSGSYLYESERPVCERFPRVSQSGSAPQFVHLHVEISRFTENQIHIHSELKSSVVYQIYQQTDFLQSEKLITFKIINLGTIVNSQE